MKIYNYHPETRQYLGSDDADANPLERGRFLIPAHATATAPPANKAGFVRRFVDGAWGYSAIETPEAPPTEEPTFTPAMVDTERDIRIAGGFIFDGVFFQSRAEDRENIAGAKMAASDAISLGAEPGELSWRQRLDPTGPAVFAWISGDNSLVPMDAQTVVRFAYAALAHKEALIFAARSIKNMTPIPADYAGNASYWP